MKKYLHSFDRVIIRKILQLPNWVRPIMLFATLLGQPPITVGLAAGMFGFGIARDNHLLVYAGLAAIVTIAVCSALKLFLHRARPDNEYVRGMLIQTFSFPSGHASGSLASFGIAAYIIALYWPTFTFIAALSVVIICFVIGISRIYLGAHYPSDVVGGWVVGILGIASVVATGLHA